MTKKESAVRAVPISNNKIILKDEPNCKISHANKARGSRIGSHCINESVKRKGASGTEKTGTEQRAFNQSIPDNPPDKKHHTYL